MELPEYWLSSPADAPSPEVRAAFDAAWKRVLLDGDCPWIDDELPAPKWQFLTHLADVHGLVLHGSGDPTIGVFEPRQANDLQAFGNQRAVYAAGYGIWVVFFAVADRDRIPSVSNACVRLADAAGREGPPRYVFSISRSALPAHTWRSGTVYVLPTPSCASRRSGSASTRCASRSWRA